MKIDEVKEWIRHAENDLFSAKLLFDNVRKPLEIICYHCAQAAEKYLKAFLVFNCVAPPKTHDLLLLLSHCNKIDNSFLSMNTECGLLNAFNNEIRYPNIIEIEEIDAKLSINYVEKIIQFKAIDNMIKTIYCST